MIWFAVLHKLLYCVPYKITTKILRAKKRPTFQRLVVMKRLHMIPTILHLYHLRLKDSNIFEKFSKYLTKHMLINLSGKPYNTTRFFGRENGP